jgi:short-subunit dehydrogenase
MLRLHFFDKVTEAFAPLVTKHQGRIVNIGSIAGVIGAKHAA